MSEFARLKEKLTLLRQRERVSGEGRRLQGASPDARMAALVTEIDETILPRRLSFAVEDGAVLHLAVANRRLQALVAPVPKLDDVDLSELADAPLLDVDVPEVSKLQYALLAFFASDKPIAIQSSRQSGAGFPSDVGVPAGILMRAWNTDSATLKSLGPEEMITRFISSLGDDVFAWLRIEGEDVVDYGGDEKTVETLGEQAAIFLDGYFAKYDVLFPESDDIAGTALGPANDVGSAAVYVEAGGVAVFVSVKANKLVDIMARWQALRAP